MLHKRVRLCPCDRDFIVWSPYFKLNILFTPKQAYVRIIKLGFIDVYGFINL